MRNIFFLLILCVLSTLTGAQSLKVMTYNIRYDTPNDGVNAWPNRKQKVFDLIKKYDPDLIGVQEALKHQLTDMLKALPAYHYVGVGREDGKDKGEFSAILYRKGRFTVQEQNTFWLSGTPEVAGSKSWDAALTRIASWATLKDNQSGREFVICNTHFDHVGAEARKQSAALLKSKVSALAPDKPVIITGDLNCLREDPPYKVLTNNEEIELIDPASEPKGTFCSFAVNSIECRAIDYIFVTNEWHADRYTVVEDNDGKHYPSDHLPVIVTLSLTE
jgi:endonuclease/exonuclease/phosphatase family metal-dependent hydrolase